MEKTLAVDLQFVSAGCNRAPNAASWGQSDLLAYGTNCLVTIYDPKAVRVICTLQGHQGRVNVTHWAATNSQQNELFSSASDGTILLWKMEADGRHFSHWSLASTLAGHTDAVTCLSSYQAASGVLFLASTSADGTVKIWKRDATSSDWSCIQTIQYGPKIIETVAITSIPNSNRLILATGGVDCKIHLYIQQDVDGPLLHITGMQGHLDWIRALSFATDDSGHLLLASASQDNNIRLWKFQLETPESTQHLVQQPLAHDALSSSLSRRGTVFRVSSETYSVIFEALLAGHEDRVYAVQWQPSFMKDGVKHQPMSLVSASMDRSMMIWKPDPESGIWSAHVTVGLLSGHALGFLGGMFSTDARYILSHGYNGAFHLWKNEGDEERYDWRPQVVISGHFNEVEDLDWDPSGNYLVSVSADQTTRLFAPWHTNNTWHEIARPQIHGYDMSCVSMTRVRQHQFISGADEKVLRVFDAPQTFVDTLQTISGVNQVGNESRAKRAFVANVPELGLSNKPIFVSAAEEKEKESMAQQHDGVVAEKQLNAPTSTAQSTKAKTPSSNKKQKGKGEDEEEGGGHSLDTAVGFGTVDVETVEVVTRPPLEEYLIQNTLWPETDKLYGHGYELISLAVNHKGSLVASACKAQTSDHAAIRLWETDKWKQVATLPGHTLTVVQMEFSHNDRYLLSVSRDRQWILFSVEESAGEVAVSIVARNKLHARIIWTCAWTLDDRYFATGSRDKTVRVWKQNASQPLAWQEDSMLPACQHAVTAVAFAQTLVNGSRMLAVGLESGQLQLYLGSETGSAESVQWSLHMELDANISHAGTIRRLKWRSISSNENAPNAVTAVADNMLQLASCGVDHTVRLYNIKLTQNS